MNLSDPATITTPEITGFINHHAIDGTDKVTVELADGTRLEGTLHELAVFSGQLTDLLTRTTWARVRASEENRPVEPHGWTLQYTQSGDGLRFRTRCGCGWRSEWLSSSGLAEGAHDTHLDETRNTKAA